MLIFLDQFCIFFLECITFFQFGVKRAKKTLIPYWTSFPGETSFHLLPPTDQLFQGKSCGHAPFVNLPASYQVRPDPGPLVHLREIFLKGPLFYAWPSRVAQCSVTCFVDATNSRVAGISGHGMFSFPLRSLRPIFEAEFMASLYGIYSHLPFSNNVRLIGDNTGVLYSVQKGSSRNLTSNYFLQNLADLWHKYPFHFWYIPSNLNPADFFTHHY